MSPFLCLLPEGSLNAVQQLASTAVDLVQRNALLADNANTANQRAYVYWNVAARLSLVSDIDSAAAWETLP
jgi:hypothetical protein